MQRKGKSTKGSKRNLDAKNPATLSTGFKTQYASFPYADRKRPQTAQPNGSMVGKNLSNNLTKATSQLSKYTMQEEEKSRECERYAEFIENVKIEIKASKENTLALKRNQERLFTNMKDLQGQTYKMNNEDHIFKKDIEKTKKTINSLSAEVESESNGNQELRKMIHQENSLITELKDIIHKVKLEMQVQNKEKERLRREWLVSEKQAELITEKRNLLLGEVKHFIKDAKATAATKRVKYNEGNK